MRSGPSLGADDALEGLVHLLLLLDGQRRVLADSSLLGDFERWRVDVARTAADRGIRFTDFANLGAQFPFDPRQGSTPYWLDNLHYTPALGVIILKRLGLPTREQPVAAARAP